MAEVFKRTQPDHPQLAGALETVEGGEMQTDLRMLADDMERNVVPAPGDWVARYYMTPEWNPGGREAYLAQRERIGLGRNIDRAEGDKQ